MPRILAQALRLTVAAIALAGLVATWLWIGEAFADRTRVARFHGQPVADTGWDGGYDAGYDAGLASEKSTLFAASSDDYVTFANRSSFLAGPHPDAGSGSGPTRTQQSVSCWIRPTAVTGGTFGPFVAIWDDAFNQINFRVYNGNQVQYMVSGGDAGTSYTARTSAVVLTTGTYTHVVGVYDGTNGFVIYTDAVSRALTTDGVNPNAVVSSPSALAQGNLTQALSGVHALAGYLDECALFACALSAADVTAIYNAGKPTHFDALSLTCPPSWWNRHGENPGTNPNQSDQLGGANGSCTNMASDPCINTTVVP